MNTEKDASANNLGPSETNEVESVEKDEWLGVLSRPTRRIGNTPYFLSRMGDAVPPEQHEKRVNAHGYDRDDPKDAIVKYEALHPQSLMRRAWNYVTDRLSDIVSFCIPRALSISAGEKKQRIDQREVLRVVRESVDKFPELKIRISKEAFDLMNGEDQMRWHEKMTTIRAAQHDYIANELANIYPDHINQEAPTILYTGGRATGLLRVLYCSVDEYVALYWSDWGLMSTDSGSYRAHVYDYITEGQNVNWNAHYHDFKAKDYEMTEPGEYTFLGRDDRKIWSFEGPCGMVDHGIGDVMSMVKFAVINNFTTTLNYKEVGSLLTNQAKAVLHEYGVRLKESLGFTSISVEPVSRVNANELADARQYFSKIMERVLKM